MVYAISLFYSPETKAFYPFVVPPSIDHGGLEYPGALSDYDWHKVRGLLRDITKSLRRKGYIDLSIDHGGEQALEPGTHAFVAYQLRGYVPRRQT